jgi:hypothetical protein
MQLLADRLVETNVVETVRRPGKCLGGTAQSGERPCDLALHHPTSPRAAQAAVSIMITVENY